MNEDMISRIFATSSMVKTVPEDAEYIGKIESRNCYIMLYKTDNGYVHRTELFGEE